MTKNSDTPNDLFADVLKAKTEKVEETSKAAKTEAVQKTEDTVAEKTKEVPPEAPKQEAKTQEAPEEPKQPETAKVEQVQTTVMPEPVIETEPAPVAMSELDMLKDRARMMGVSFSNNISVETLRAKVKAKLDGVPEEDPEIEEPAEEEISNDGRMHRSTYVPKALTAAERNMQKRREIYEENMRLVRVRISNLDPKKKELPGEILTVANEYLGTVRKFIPFGEATDNGYHVPYVLYKALKRRKFLQIRTRKGRNGTPIVESNWVREFNLEVLPQLTVEELADLKAQQAARGSE